MRVLITGAQGFIGRHLFNHLVTQRPDWEVTGWDLPLMDITKPLKTHRSLDAVIHLAAIASPLTCDQDPGLAFRVNVQGTHNILKMAVAAGAKRFIMASTAHCYGVSPRYFPTDERHPLWLQDNYTTTKILSEQLCHLFWDNYGLSYAAIRLFNGYGPGQQLGYFVPDIIARAKAGAIVLRGSQVTKDWIYIDDLVQAYLLALESDFVGALNVGTGRETSLGEVAERIARSFGIPLAFGGEPQGGPTRMLCDWRRAKSVLGWEPKVSLEEGLERTIESWKDHA